MILPRLRRPGERRAHQRLEQCDPQDVMDTIAYHGNSINRAAKALGVCHDSVTGYLQRRGLAIPRPDHCRRKLERISSQELLRVLRLNHGNIRPVAEMYALHPSTMRAELNRRGIRTEKGTRRANWSKELLEDLYVKQGLSLWLIGERFGVSATAVAHRMRKFGIPRRAFVDPRYGGGIRR